MNLIRVWASTHWWVLLIAVLSVDGVLFSFLIWREHRRWLEPDQWLKRLRDEHFPSEGD